MKKMLMIMTVIICWAYLELPVMSQNGEAQKLAEEIAAKKVQQKQELSDWLGKTQKLYDDGEYSDALSECEEMLEKYPSSKDAQKLYEMCKVKQQALLTADLVARKKRDMSRVMKDLDNEFIYMFRRPDERDLEREEWIEKMLALVKDFWNVGQYQDAIDVCDTIIERFPPDVKSRVRINELLEDMRRYAEEDSDIVERERILAVRKAWLSPEKSREKIEEDDVKDNIQDNIISDDKQKLLAKANRIIPEINFTNAHLRDVIQYLSRVSAVNIILDETSFASGTDTTAEIDDRITISLKNIPLLEALKYILITKGMEFRVEDHAIWIAKSVEDVEMLTRMYQLPVGNGVQRVLTYEGTSQQDNISGGTTIETGGDITQLLREAVPFPPGAKLFLDPRTSTLIVTNTVANHSLIEEVLKSIAKAPIQVQIEAKFVQIRQTDMNELGFEFFLTEDWQVDGQSPTVLSSTTDATYGQYAGATDSASYGFTRGLRFGSDSSVLRLSGILTDPEFSTILHALSQNEITDVISAPKVTTINGQQAIIKDVEEIIYPLEFTVTQATYNDDGDAVTPSVVTVGDFQTRKIGIVLSVTPDVGSDNKTITLSIMPEVSSVNTWINYGSDQAPINVPHFDSENLVTTVIINDGETVVMGGLIRDAVTKTKDKIPMLGDIPYIGRAFRSEREETVKTNLLVFVTAKIITPSGNEYKDVVANTR
ncbi:MAG: hypothetical protein C4541_11885 [Candidatus Auribacter fodinae]|jgi:general secretion pathway protein D|uniref:Type II/III secretion system secretin-like domain-containing protein n=1 Tax=Candidatus Auribacter fodinae TaxID=2093366 RepID=A0A3A4QRQ9_9BACT|nr:MAG: hypothetical protein C4541_11885 [Candidatus Auribacter fodinae]